MWLIQKTHGIELGQGTQWPVFTILQVDVVGQRKWEMEREAAHPAGLRLGLDAEEAGCKSKPPTNSPWAFGERVTSLLQLHQFWNGNRSFFFRRMLGGRAG